MFARFILINYLTGYSHRETSAINYCFQEDMVGIRPCCLSHDCICPMTIWVFYQKKPLSPMIDRESLRGNASFRG